jgi:hypothetical protein
MRVRRHLFFFLALIPFGYLFFSDFESTDDLTLKRIAAISGVVLMGMYVFSGVKRPPSGYNEEDPKD